jgi:hypothetical protein
MFTTAIPAPAASRVTEKFQDGMDDDERHHPMGPTRANPWNPHQLNSYIC